MILCIRSGHTHSDVPRLRPIAVWREHCIAEAIRARVGNQARRSFVKANYVLEIRKECVDSIGKLDPTGVGALTGGQQSSLAPTLGRLLSRY